MISIAKYKQSLAISTQSSVSPLIIAILLNRLLLEKKEAYDKLVSISILILFRGTKLFIEFQFVYKLILDVFLM